MKLSGTYTLAAPREKVFAALVDPAVLERCIPGCEQLVKTGEDNYDIRLKVGVAGLKGRYAGKAQLKDKNPPSAYTLVVEGKGAPGFARGSARIQLVARGSETELLCDADAQVGGTIAAVGSRLIEAVARKQMAEFFAALARQLQSR